MYIYICTTIYILPLIVTLFANILYASITNVDHKLIIQSSILENWEMSWQDHWIITFSTIVTVIVTMTASKVLWLVNSCLLIQKKVSKQLKQYYISYHFVLNSHHASWPQPSLPIGLYCEPFPASQCGKNQPCLSIYWRFICPARLQDQHTMHSYAFSIPHSRDAISLE